MMLLLILALVLAAPCFGQTADTYRRAATEFAQKKSWDEAIANYQKALSLDPKDALTHYNLALALKYKGDPSAAAEEFKKAVLLKPKSAEAHYGLGAAYYDLRELPAARKELQTSLQIDPTNSAVLRFLARIDSEQNDLSDAERELTRSAELKALPDTYFELGLVKGQLGNLAGAALAFRHALRLDPRSEPAHLMLGITLR